MEVDHIFYKLWEALAFARRRLTQHYTNIGTTEHATTVLLSYTNPEPKVYSHEMYTSWNEKGKIKEEMYFSA